ncbi:MAG: DUF1905 domain-containing protein [Bacteroidota bacterium]
MITFSARIQKFANQGEKTGWTYIEISRRQAEQLKPDSRVSFRVKGKLDAHPIQKAALLPMGEGKYILPLNASIRKGIGKKAGDTLKVQFEVDGREYKLSHDFIQCLKDDPKAYDFFKTLSKSHQHYFGKWIDSAKTISTKTKRITLSVIALASRQGFSEMLRANKKVRE